MDLNNLVPDNFGELLRRIGYADDNISKTLTLPPGDKGGGAENTLGAKIRYAQVPGERDKSAKRAPAYLSTGAALHLTLGTTCAIFIQAGKSSARLQSVCRHARDEATVPLSTALFAQRRTAALSA